MSTHEVDVPDELVRIEREGAVLHLRLNRPDKRNAVTQAMWEAIIAQLTALAVDPAVKVLVLGSTSPAVFSAGADIAEFEAIGRDPERAKANNAAIRESHRLLGHFPKPTIAMIAGPCVGAGCGLALACDMRVAADTARFGITPAKLGLIYPLQDTKRLVDLVGPSQARMILFTGRLVDAAHALRIGLIDEVTTPDALDDTVRALAADLCAASQHSIRGSKRIIQMVLDGVADDTAETSAMFASAFAGPDHLEGRSAFLEKRPARFPVR